MIKTDVFIADPYNENHIKLYKQFEKEKNLPNTASKYLEELSHKYTKEEYNNNLQKSNEIMTSLFVVKDNEISDFCLIKYEKDRKIANVTYPKLEKTKRKIVSASTEYIFNILSLEEMFVSVNNNDNSITTTLLENGFESLGNTNNMIQFIKEKPIESEIKRSRTWK